MTIFLDNLPNEVLLKVFTYLNIRDLGYCAQVSKRLGDISIDESLWQKINVFNKVVPTGFIQHILKRGCQYLNLNSAVLEGDSEFPTKSKLKYLDLSHTKADFGILEELVGTCNSLEKLSLDGSTINVDTLTNVSLKNGSTLKVMDLSVFSGLNETMMIFVEYCDNLTELNLCFLTKYRSMVRDQWWHNLNLQNISYLVNNLTTSIQKISFCSLKCVNDEHIKILVNRCNKITELDLNYTNITNMSAYYIIEALGDNLTRLDVSNTKIDSTKLLELKSMPKLEFFRAVNCQILGDIRTEALVEIYNSNLPSLHFEIAKPTNLNCQSPKEGLWDVSVKQIELFEDNPDTVSDAAVNETEPGSSENSDIE